MKTNKRELVTVMDGFFSHLDPYTKILIVNSS